MGGEDRFKELQGKAIELKARSARALRDSERLRAASDDLRAQAAESRRRFDREQRRFMRVVEWWTSRTGQGQELTYAGVTVPPLDGQVAGHRDRHNSVERR